MNSSIKNGTFNNNRSVSPLGKSPPITKIINHSSDLDFDYLDLNEMNNAINGNEMVEYILNLNDNNEDDVNAAKTKRSILADPQTEQNNSSKHHHRYSRYESLLLKELSQLGIKNEKLLNYLKDHF